MPYALHINSVVERPEYGAHDSIAEERGEDFVAAAGPKEGCKWKLITANCIVEDYDILYILFIVSHYVLGSLCRLMHALGTYVGLQRLSPGYLETPSPLHSRQMSHRPHLCLMGCLWVETMLHHISRGEM